jgi:hypothetical protein
MLQGVDRIVPVDVHIVGCAASGGPLLRAAPPQDKIDKMSMAKKPTEVRLHEGMVDDFEEQIRIAQANFANPANLAPLPESAIHLLHGRGGHFSDWK